MVGILLNRKAGPSLVRTAGLLLLSTLLSGEVSGQGQVTLNFWTVGRSDDAVMYRRLAKEFEASTGIRVVVTTLGWGHFQQKYMTALAARMPPDIGATNIGGPFDYGRVGGVIDFAERFPDELAVLRAQLFPNLWASMMVENRVFGVPNGLTTAFLFYRKDVFAQLDLEPPTTWSELTAVLLRLNARGYQYNFVWPRESGWATDMWTAPFGALRVDTENRTAPWDSAPFIAGVQTAVRFWNLYDMPVDKNTKPVELFIADTSQTELLTPILIDYSLRYSEIALKAPHLDGRWGMLPIPAPDRGAAWLPFGGTALVIFEQSKQQQAAMRWLMYMMSPETQFEMMHDFMFNRGERSELFMSPNRSMYNLPDHPYEKATRDAIVTAISQIGTSSPTPGAAQIDRLLDNFFREARTAIADRIRSGAAVHRLSVRAYKSRLAQRRFIGEREQLVTFADSVSAALLTDLKPLADGELARGQMEDDLYYRNILVDLEQQKDARDVLDVSKLAVAVLVFCILLWIFFTPAARKHWRSYVFVAPPILLILVFLLIPILVSLYLSLTKYNPLLPLSMARWVGLDNYAALFTSGETWLSLSRSLYFAALTIPLQLLIGLVLAVGLDQALKPDRLFKFAFFSPLITSMVSVSLIWSALYLGTEYGWLNALLLRTGVLQDPIAFLYEEHTFLNCVIVLSIWHGLAFVILINLAGLQGIPKMLYEAATIDGAGPLQRFFRITLPSLRPQLVFLTLTGTLGAIQVFEQIFMLGGGAGESGAKFGPNDSGMTMVPLIFRRGFEDFRMGEASAVAYFLFVVLVALSLMNWKTLVREE